MILCRVPAGNLSTERSLQMRTLSRSTTRSTFSPWLTLDLTPTVYSLYFINTLLNILKIIIGSQFFITFVKTPHLDGKHVVFGEVADSTSEDIARKMESKSLDSSGRTSGTISIAAAGQH